MLGLVLAVLGRSAPRQSASVVYALRAAARETLRVPAPSKRPASPAVEGDRRRALRVIKPRYAHVESPG